MSEQPIVHIIDDDEPVRDAISMLLDTVNLAHEEHESAQDFLRHGDIPMAVEAMRRGAVDFIRKPFRDQDLLDRIQEALAVGEQQQARATRLAEARHKVADLTKREQEVFRRVASGQANKVIAIELGISERTVEIHRSHVMQKTASRTLADLVRLQLSLEADLEPRPN